MQNMTMWT